MPNPNAASNTKLIDDAVRQFPRTEDSEEKGPGNWNNAVAYIQAELGKADRAIPANKNKFLKQVMETEDRNQFFQTLHYCLDGI